ncbi:MAG: WYL domain-containing protein [Acidiferrobacterales bacterium]
MIPNVLQVLTAAVKEKRCVAIRYHDQTHIRVIEPHAIYTAENGEIVVDGYQVRGYSSSGRPPPFWRPYRVKKISAISLLKEIFQTRMHEGFAPGKDKYKGGLVAMVDDRRKSFAYPSPAIAEEMGPHLPSNPHRR